MTSLKRKTKKAIIRQAVFYNQGHLLLDFDMIRRIRAYANQYDL